MIRIQYNTQLNLKPKVLYIFTYWELFLGVVISCIPAFIFSILGLDPPLLDTILLFISYSLVIGYYKVGKPEGYLGHFLTHLITPEHFRPGKKITHYPIKPDDLLELINLEKRTPEQLWEDARRTQRLMLEANLLPKSGIGVGHYLELDTENANHLERQSAAIEFVDSGGVIGVGTKIPTQKNNK